MDTTQCCKVGEHGTTSNKSLCLSNTWDRYSCCIMYANDAEWFF